MDISKAYNVLGLSQNASEDDVKTAYRGLAQRYNPDLYEAGPLHEDAAARMDEINTAFDTVMTALRTGNAKASGNPTASTNTQPGTDRYAEIRGMITSGNADAALQRLNDISGGTNDAEWNFLVGSAYYYKGWLNDALRYFETACRLAPGNREYEAALRNLQNSANGNMYGNPYTRQQNYRSGGAGCSCCDMCTAMACMDMCCGCGNGC